MRILTILPVLALLGLADATYLTVEHYSNAVQPCSVNWWVDCGKVLTSQFAQFLGIPIAALGMLQYVIVLVLSMLLIHSLRRKLSWWLLIQATAGFVFSLYLVALQLFIIRAICLYCMASALISIAIFVSALIVVPEKRGTFLWACALAYQPIKRVLFMFDAETVHIAMVRFGEALGHSQLVRNLFQAVLSPKSPSLSQRILSITFSTPIGLSAGFDYEARLTQILHTIGFGFQTIGTISALPCAGNAKPRLGRLPRSKSLLVNKGFRNPGAQKIIRKLDSLEFSTPIGVSIGQTNTDMLNSREAVVGDILAAFNAFEKSSTQHAYYELNISCPNLHAAYNFYNPKNLDLLLEALDDLKLTRPLFVKMPISEDDGTVLALLKVIAEHSPAGVIIGNLQKDRSNPAVDPSERLGLGAGNLSGKPTFDRSNHLIALTYHYYRKRFVIIGCGGVFSAEDAYIKILLGASLVQLITGMIFQGPQLIAQINLGIAKLLKQDGYTSISEAIGKRNATYYKWYVKNVVK